MKREAGHRSDGIIVVSAAAVTAVITWLSGLIDPLDRIGATSTTARAGVVLAVTVLVMAWRVYHRRSRFLGLLEIRPQPLCVADTAALGVVESELATTASRDETVRYVERNDDGALREIMCQRQVVILIGPSGSGKSSSARAAAHQIGPNTKVYVPKRPAENVDRPLSEALLLMTGPFRRRLPEWLWLDDLGRYLDRDAVDVALLRRWLDGDPARRLVATLSSKDRDRLMDDPAAAGDSARALLNMAAKHPVRLDWSGTELQCAMTDYPGAGEACHHLGRYLSSGAYHLRRFRDAEDSCPAAAAIMHAAADWRRARQTRPVPKAWLRSAFVLYLSAPSAGVDWDTLFQRGLTWAADRRNQPEAVLEHNADRATDPRDVAEADGGFKLAEIAVEEPSVRSGRSPMACGVCFSRRSVTRLTKWRSRRPLERTNSLT